MVAMCDLINILHHHVKQCYCAKNNSFFFKMWVMLVVGPMYLAMSAAAPLKECTMLSLITDSG